MLYGALSSQADLLKSDQVLLTRLILLMSLMFASIGRIFSKSKEANLST